MVNPDMKDEYIKLSFDVIDLEEITGSHSFDS
jgi:hypothetical protein